MTFDQLEATLPTGPFGRSDPCFYTHIVTKHRKRVWVTRMETGERIYTPPDFIQICGRSDFDRMLDALNRGAWLIDAMTAFESAARVRRHRF